MKNDFLIAITQLCAEKNLSKEVVLSAIEAALISAYKRNFGSSQTQAVSVKIHPSTGEVRVFAEKTVVAEVVDMRAEVNLDQASRLKPGALVGDTVEVEATPHDFGRIAAQTAKQVVLQRLREAEREVVFEEFTNKERDIVNGVVQRLEPKRVVIDLGKVEASLPEEEQVPGEHYRMGQRVKALLVEVRRTPKGPEVRLSRTHRDLLRRLFELEVPEIYQGTVELKSIAREPGSRSKVAVAARQEGMNPVGSCVGMRGIRIQNIVRELNDEKIDVVQWHADSAVFVANALSPAQVLHVDINEADKTATVVVPDRQLSLAIGKEGQNARLAAKLTGWRIDIKSSSAAKVEREARRLAEEEAAREAAVAATAAAELAAAEAAEAAALAAALAPPVEESAVIPEPVLEVPVVAEEQPVAEVPAEPVLAEPEAPAAEVVAPETQAPVQEAPVEVPPATDVAPAAADKQAPERPDRWKRELPAEEFPKYEPAVEEVRAPAEAVSQIRFAEDFFGDSGYRLDGKKKKGKKAEEREPQAVVKAKKPARRPRTETEEDELPDYNHLVRGQGRR